MKGGYWPLFNTADSKAVRAAPNFIPVALKIAESVDQRGLPFLLAICTVKARASYQLVTAGREVDIAV
jgi:hypothetical protein